MIRPRPYPRLKRRKYVTIAAGFKCTDGFIMCSDSEETGMAFKRRVPKLEIKPDPQGPKDVCRIVFTGSGSASFVDALIEEMWKGAQRAEESRLEVVLAWVKAAMLGYYKQIWSIYPKQMDKRQLPEADLMFGIWTQQGSGLFLARSHDITEVKSYATVGVGDELAQYICDPLFKVEMATRQAAILAIYMLSEVKAKVQNCGGESHVAILKNDGTISVIPPIGAYFVGNQLASFDQALRQILLSTTDEDINDADFQRVFDMFREEITRLRQQYRINHAEFWQEIERVDRHLKSVARKYLKPSVSRKSKRAR